MSQEEILRKLEQAVIDCEPEDAEDLAREALAQNLDALTCINEGLTPGINEVGRLFATGEYYLPDLIIAGEAMKAALGVLEPALMEDQQRQVLGRVVLGTVEGDLHEIGKTLVGTMLTANGFDVHDIGIDKSAADFVAAVRETDATVVGASALLTTTMLQQGKIIDALQEAGLRDKVKVMVGGAPVTAEWAEKVGADGYSEDAIGAVALAKRLVGAG
jgi:corrinoid protein of di/trimethylamine methyltransferase